MNDVKTGVIENKHGIRLNEQSIKHNKAAIDEIKKGFVSQEVFMKTTSRLIMALCVAIVVILISNVIWIMIWTAKRETTIITNDGVSNVIGHDGTIREGE